MNAKRRELERLAQLAHQRLGLDIERGAAMSALVRYVERCGSFERALEAAEQSATFQDLVDAVTVQHSWLFRDPRQLEIACSKLTEPAPTLRRVWVPACATGEDVYTLLALLGARTVSASVLGTDVHERAIEQARLGRYTASSTRYVPSEHRAMLVGAGDVKTIATDLRQGASFHTHNLLDRPPSSAAADGKWDLIVCRNVLIYFSHAHTQRVLAHLRDALSPAGTLVLGASDIMTELPPGLEAIEREGRVVFQRTRATAVTTPRAAPVPTERAVPGEPANVGVVPAGREGRPTLAMTCDEVDAVTLLLRGLDAHWSGELLSASRDLRGAVYLLPRLWPAWYYLAQAYDGLGRFVEARRAYGQAALHLEAGASLPPVPGHDFAFLRADVAASIKGRLEPSVTRRAKRP